MTHGTDYGYEHGCRCIDCRAAHASRWAAIKKAKRHLGPRMALNHAELQRAFAQSGRTQSDIAGDAGLNTATVGYMLSGARDTATLYVLDAVACALGVHYSTLTTDDIASVEVAV